MSCVPIKEEVVDNSDYDNETTTVSEKHTDSQALEDQTASHQGKVSRCMYVCMYVIKV